MAKVRKSLFSESLQNAFKLNASDFSRRRKQSFSGTVVFMINLIRKSLAIEIENFVCYCNTFCPDSDLKLFTKSAFVQYRKKISSKVFKHLSNVLVDEFYTDNDLSVKIWNGFRLLAVDGSRLNLPNTKELASYYGETKNQNNSGVVQARVSVLYDVLNNYVLDGILSPLSVGESKLAVKHLKSCKSNDLIIFDRGYPGFPLIYELNKADVDFVIRVKISFNSLIESFAQSGEKSKIVEIESGKKKSFVGLPFSRNSRIKIRLIRVDLGNEKFEILMTSLVDESVYDHGIFKDLYFQRWKVETFYDELKNKLKIEYFSGYSRQIIEQDFEASLFVSNVQSLIVGELNDEIKAQNINKKTQYDYKINTALSYGILKNKIISIFLDSKESESMVDELKLVFKKYLVPIRPDRKFERNPEKYKRRVKPKIPKNQKDTF